jgi:hypothetical protein
MRTCWLSTFNGYCEGLVEEQSTCRKEEENAQTIHVFKVQTFLENRFLKQRQGVFHIPAQRKRGLTFTTFVRRVYIPSPAYSRCTYGKAAAYFCSTCFSFA